MKIVIEGNNVLSGTVKIGGDKNSVVALLPAAVLSSGTVKINNVPSISDVDVLNNVLVDLGAKVTNYGKSVTVDLTDISNKLIKEEYSSRLRASYYFMGSLLGRFKKVDIYFPGGCSIGKRPINIHLDGFRSLGANVVEDGNRFTITADELKGANIDLAFPSVGATINIMLAAVLAKGITVITNCAKEPQIENIAEFLNKMGAKISGYGTSTITIEGVESLGSCEIDVISDRIEAATYLVIGSVIGDNLEVSNINVSHLSSVLTKMHEIGVPLSIRENSIIVSKGTNYKPVAITTEVYPGFVTDVQQPFTVLLSKCEGMSSVSEKIWENRFMHVEHLNKMGTNIELLDDNNIVVYGNTDLVGTSVVATDLRGGAAMVVAGLCADGITEITEIEHILRGYEDIIEKLTNVGAKIHTDKI